MRPRNGKRPATASTVNEARESVSTDDAQTSSRISEDPQADRAEDLGTNERLRKRCRNLRCRSKLPAPTDNDRAAFCCRGCFDQFHRTKCVVCGGAIQRKTEAQRTCWVPRCRAELRKRRETYLPFEPPKSAPGHSPTGASFTASEVPAKRASFWPDRGGRGWAWVRLPGDDDDWTLLARTGAVAAGVRQEGSGWWVARPRASPEPPVEPLADAKRRAVSLALAAMDPPPYRQPSAVTGARSTAGEDYARGVPRGDSGSDWQPSSSISPDNPDLAIPNFLHRAGSRSTKT